MKPLVKNPMKSLGSFSNRIIQPKKPIIQITGLVKPRKT